MPVGSTASYTYTTESDLQGPPHAPTLRDDSYFDVSYTVNAESSNTITVNCQVTDRAGNALGGKVLHQYLSSDSAGLAPVAAATSLVAGTDGAVAETISNSVWIATTETDGDLDIVVGDTSTGTYYLNTILPSGSLSTSAVIQFA